MALRIVDISDLLVSKNPTDILVTYSLGSCIGVTVYDPIARVGGMIHFMLPESKVSPEKARRKPGMFADTGVPMLFKKIFALGGSKDGLIVKAAGGSQLMDQNKVFNIGERNFVILRKMLWRNNILMKAHDIGGTLTRTVRLDMATGQTTVKSSRGEIEL